MVAPPTDIATPAGRVVAQLVIFAVLTVPVTVWFAGWEATPGGATPGKRLLGLRVLTTSGDRLAWRRSLVRTALKFTIPWELAHTAVWNMLVWPGDRGAAVDTLLLSLANPAWRFVAVGIGHDVPYWTEFLRALAEIDPGMAVNIEHEDASYSRIEGITIAAANLRAAAAKM